MNNSLPSNSSGVLGQGWPSQLTLNPLSAKSDKHLISPYNITS